MSETDFTAASGLDGTCVDKSPPVGLGVVGRAPDPVGDGVDIRVGVVYRHGLQERAVDSRQAAPDRFDDLLEHCLFGFENPNSGVLRGDTAVWRGHLPAVIAQQLDGERMSARRMDGEVESVVVDASASTGDWLSQRGLGVISFEGEQAGSGAALEEGHSPVGQQRFVDFGQGRSDEGQRQ